MSHGKVTIACTEQVDMEPLLVIATAEHKKEKPKKDYDEHKRGTREHRWKTIIQGRED